MTAKAFRPSGDTPATDLINVNKIAAELPRELASLAYRLPGSAFTFSMAAHDPVPAVVAILS